MIITLEKEKNHPNDNKLKIFGLFRCIADQEKE
jgi:hypothetical protein